MFADLDRSGGTGWHTGSLTSWLSRLADELTNKIGTAGGSRPIQEQAVLLNYQAEYLEVLLAIERAPISTRSGNVRVGGLG